MFSGPAGVTHCRRAGPLPAVPGSPAPSDLAGQTCPQVERAQLKFLRGLITAVGGNSSMLVPESTEEKPSSVTNQTDTKTDNPARRKGIQSGKSRHWQVLRWGTTVDVLTLDGPCNSNLKSSNLLIFWCSRRPSSVPRGSP